MTIQRFRGHISGNNLENPRLNMPQGKPCIDAVGLIWQLSQLARGRAEVGAGHADRVFLWGESKDLMQEKNEDRV